VALNLENAIPMRWPSGPLEIARREKTPGFSPRVRQALELAEEGGELREVLLATVRD